MKLEIFFFQYKNKVSNGFILQEFHSDQTISEDTFYVHNFNKIFKDANLNDNFEINFKKIKYSAWENKKAKPFQIEILKK